MNEGLSFQDTKNGGVVVALEIILGTTILSSSIYGFLAQHKKPNKDHEKIIEIADSLGLKTKKESIRIYRKRQKKDHMEYVYKIPLGLSFNDFEKHKQTFIDGLNNKSSPDFQLSNFKDIKLNGNILEQIQDAFNQRKPLDKQIELDYDGMLKFRVYDEGLKSKYNITTDIMKKGSKWSVPLGVKQNGIVEHDFESSPHMLIGGATDTGKSTILNNTITTLLYNNPDDVEFTLIDLKGGLEFGDYENIKQTKNFATELEEAEEVLRKVKERMLSDFEMLRNKGKRKVQQAGIRKRHFVIIDEAAELSTEGEQDKTIKALKVNCENHIKSIAARGRACGIRLIYSTQYPTRETINSQVKRNLIARVCLSVDTTIASQVVLDEGGAEKLPYLPGRAIYKRQKCTEMQSFFLDDDLLESIIKPHIKEGKRASTQRKKPTTTRTDSPQLKEVGLSD